MEERASIYNNARLIFHAIGPKFHSEFEGIDPSQSIEALETTLGSFMEQNQNISAKIRDSIVKAQKSLSSAKTQYLICRELVKLSTEPDVVHELAVRLSHDAKNLSDDQSHPSILFIGGHYLHPKGGSLGGHTASYETVRQDNGKLSFIINNTIPTEKHKTYGDRIYQLVYKDLEAADLDIDFWKNVIRTNYMNPVQGKFWMEAFYNYVNEKLLKSFNRVIGRSFKRQLVGTCAWKSVSVWLHGKISAGLRDENREACGELAYAQFKRHLLETMLAHFKPKELPSTIFLKTELERKVQQMNTKCQLLRDSQ